MSVIAAGHAAARTSRMLMLDDPADEDGYDGSKTILKELDVEELETYERMSKLFTHDMALQFIPSYHGVIEDLEDRAGKFLQLGNLLRGFVKPKVMDVKLGCRTFCETECESIKGRADLYKRMQLMYPDALTEKERAAESITKFKWMTVRDMQTTSASHSYRIQGIAGHHRRRREDVELELEKIRTEGELVGAFEAFAELAATDDGNEVFGANPLAIAQYILEELRHMSSVLSISPFVMSHDFVGTSILIVADSTGKVGAFWIDFAKVRPVPEGLKVTHRDKWVLGNHEDGLLVGIDNLITSWSRVVECLDVSLRRSSRNQLGPGFSLPYDGGDPIKSIAMSEMSFRSAGCASRTSSQEAEWSIPLSEYSRDNNRGCHNGCFQSSDKPWWWQKRRSVAGKAIRRSPPAKGSR